MEEQKLNNDSQPALQQADVTGRCGLIKNRFSNLKNIKNA